MEYELTIIQENNLEMKRTIAILFRGPIKIVEARFLMLHTEIRQINKILLENKKKGLMSKRERERVFFYFSCTLNQLNASHRVHLTVLTSVPC